MGLLSYKSSWLEADPDFQTKMVRPTPSNNYAMRQKTKVNGRTNDDAIEGEEVDNFLHPFVNIAIGFGRGGGLHM